MEVLAHLGYMRLIQDYFDHWDIKSTVICGLGPADVRLQ